ncbi:phytoene desaturase family protein [Stappia indica]|uniref:phytoene desaturase family protein n=1 Tax=Stappia indica TaxID=538381 RepID=UPI001CD6B3DE|nr:NAD(P)/FAD-dependent oxidoreductase [Stappia indica]MCA1300598.1 NAD(P)/FAD-dependent oxidoreductase [Stappia indica]
MDGKFDAILVGAGHNALACALHLCARGWRVAVFEQAPEPGGAVRSGAYTLPGFRHDFAAMNLSLFAGSKFHGDYAEELARNGLEFVPVNRPFASVFPDDGWLGVETDTAATRARIAELSEVDAQTWDRLSDAFDGEAEHILRLLGASMKINAFASFLFKVLRAKGLRGSLEFARFLASSPRAWLEETFEHPKVQALLGAWGMHLDYAPDISGGAVFPYLEGMAGQAFGMVIGKGGADTVTRALVSAIRARGGVVECEAPVARILHSSGKASGVKLADGRRFSAGRAVIAGVAPGALVRLTGGTGKPAFDGKMTRFSHAPGTMMLHLALSDLPNWRAGEVLRRFAYVHLAPSLDQMARTYQQARAGLLPDEPVIVAGQPTVFDDSRAPVGQHVLWLQVRMVPGDIQGDAAGRIAARDWETAAEPMAERVLDILDGYAPGIRDRILARHVVTPPMFEAANPNLVGGDQICGSHHLSQHFVFRPAVGAADGSTPIRNLHMTGAAVWPGAGTGAGSGYLLARKLVGK